MVSEVQKNPRSFLPQLLNKILHLASLNQSPGQWECTALMSLHWSLLISERITETKRWWLCWHTTRPTPDVKGRANSSATPAGEIGVHGLALSICFPYQPAEWLLVSSSWFMDVSSWLLAPPPPSWCFLGHSPLLVPVVLSSLLNLLSHGLQCRVASGSREPW